MKELAKLGIGVAIVARWTARAELESGQLRAVPLPRGKIARKWVACSLKDRQLSLAETTFIGLCEQVGKKMEN